MSFLQASQLQHHIPTIQKINSDTRSSQKRGFAVNDFWVAGKESCIIPIMCKRIAGERKQNESIEDYKY